MIIKGIDTKKPKNRLHQAGHEAEKQMAFYLKRAFQKEREILIINDLRLELNNDVAQIDHLVIHRFGFIVIESKSVTSEITINEQNEWIRHYSSKAKGIPSPVKQAERQIEFLKSFLMLRTEQLLRRRKIFKTTIKDYQFDILVAISDSGIINRASATEASQVFKADQITAEALEIIKKYKKVNNNLLTSKVYYQLADSSMVKIVKFLAVSHKTKKIEKAQAVVKITKAKETKKCSNEELNNQREHTCSKCNSSHIQIIYGRYGYYFKCSECDGNTSIKPKCSKEICKARIRKDRNNYYKECSICNTSKLHFINKNTENPVT